MKDVHDETVKVLDFFEDMGYKLAIIAELESTFVDKPLMKPALEATYTAIVAFWIEAVRHYRGRFRLKRE